MNSNNYTKKLSLVLLVGLALATLNASADDTVFSSNQTATTPVRIYDTSNHSAVRNITVNSGITLTSAGSGWGVQVFSITDTVSSLINRGTITGNYYTIYFGSSGLISSFVNYGSIINTNGATISTRGGTITELTNLGTISSIYSASIDNSGMMMMPPGIIGTLNNLQGASSSALTLKGALPSNYNIIINSTADYGQLLVTSPSGSTTFGISSLSGTNIGNTGTRYQNVLSGITGSNISNANTTLNYTNGSLTSTYQLVADDGNMANTWDLLILSYLNGPSLVDTQSSIHRLSSNLRTGFTQQTIASNFANMNTYDCNLFDAKGICMSVGGQQTYIDNPSSNVTSTVVVAGYKVSPHIRIGGFLNQNLNNNTNANVHISNKNPLMGFFGVWNKNENGLGYQVKLANAYQDKDISTTRDIIGSSEAGKGSTNLNTQSYVGEVSYAFMLNDKTLVRPYIALRSTTIQQDAYTEDSSVTAPLTYSAIKDRSLTSLVGIKLNHALTSKMSLTGSLGIEQDLEHHVDNLTATGVNGLTSENFNDSIKRTRPVASAGAYFTPVRNQRISGELFYQQLPFQSTGSTTAYVSYAIGF